MVFVLVPSQDDEGDIEDGNKCQEERVMDKDSVNLINCEDTHSANCDKVGPMLISVKLDS